MKFELSTLDSYDDASLKTEICRVAELLGDGRFTMEFFNKHSKVSASTVHRRFGSWKAVAKIAGCDESVSPNATVLSESDLLALIKSTAEMVGRETLTMREFTEETGVSNNPIHRVFGSWKNALDAAGLASVALGRRYSDNECFENILNLWTHYGRQPKFGELKKPPSTVGPKAYIIRWGGWRAALRAFVARVDSDGGMAAVEQPNDSQDDQSEYAVVESRPVEPRTLGLGLRYKILKRDDFRCVLCGQSPAKTPGLELQVDHIIHWSRGGTNDPSNLRTTCKPCNLGRGDRE